MLQGGLQARTHFAVRREALSGQFGALVDEFQNLAIKLVDLPLRRGFRAP
jgi:hypothetical protein